jgi:Fic family protein
MLDADDRRVLAEIEDFRRQLRYQLGEPRRWQGQLRRTLTARAIQGSNSIEGYEVSLDDAEDVVEHEPPLEGAGSVPPEIVGYRDALTYVRQLADHPHFRYERMLLSALHFLMLGHRLDMSPGRYRTGTIFVRNDQTGVVVYEGPDPDRAPVLVDELVDWLNDGDRDAPVFARAAMAHLNLVKIHPWRDGNGRMARCLQTLVLARDGVLSAELCSIEEWLGAGRNTYDYYDVLAEVGGRTWSPERGTHAWVRFCLRAHHLQAHLVLRRFEQYASLWVALEELTTRHGLPERTVAALFTAARGARVRRATYQHDAGLTEGQAVRDLRLLAQHDLIRPHGETKARHYTATSRLTTLSRQVTADPPPTREPYQR